ncbi:MAG: sulfotransferase [Proteobacteria bacterium]|nr:sulfotransferase [Pseudomonadota bacterium]MBU4036688.1 sulfotransferase [Pseudomonadota bacterium]
MELSETTLLREAEQRSGLSDWGSDQTFRIGLRVLVEALLETEPLPKVFERFTAHMIDLLVTRLRLVDDARRHPEIMAIKIERPIILIGLSRTGTTILHNLMALDPAARAPLEWETAHPWPAPEVATFDTDPRISQMQAQIEGLFAALPILKKMHPFGATLPADCLNLMALHFASARFFTFYGVPRFVKWLAETPIDGLYNTHKRVLQQLQWKGPHGRWTLKEPMHQLNLDQLAATYPDACFVQTHRDPVRTIPSGSNVIWTIFQMQDPRAKRKEIGHLAAHLFGACLERSTASRAHDPQLDARVLDIAYRDTVLDPVGQVRRIHQHFNLPFSAEHVRRIEQYIAENPKSKHGSHHYNAEDYGFNSVDIMQQFQQYRARFGHLLSDPEH